MRLRRVTKKEFEDFLNSFRKAVMMFRIGEDSYLYKEGDDIIAAQKPNQYYILHSFK